MPPSLKDTIRTYIYHLREAIDNAEDLSEARRAVLLRKLAEFEAELEKKRLNLLAVTVLAITFLSAPGGLGATADMATKLVNNIMRVVGEAKSADDEMRRVPSSVEPMVITGPRPPAKDDMDDEIPF